MEIGLLAFIAGMLAGFISLRALGWLCVYGLLVVGGSALGSAHTYVVHNTGSSGAYFVLLESRKFNGAICGSTWNVSCMVGSTFLAAGASTSVINGRCDVCELQVDCRWSASSLLCDGSGNNGGSYNDATGCTSGQYDFYINGSAPPPSYISSGCVTNNTANMAGFFVHFSPTLDDGTHDMGSGPLAPGQWWCINKTNSVPYQTQVEMVLYNSDGGTNTVTVGDPGWAGTNAANPNPYPQPGNPYPGNPITGGPGSGSGVGSNTNLTGGQFAGGMSNLINVTLSTGNLLVGLGGEQLNELRKIDTNTSGQIDYRGYLITLTNQGSAHLSMTQVLTNLNGMLYTQVVQVAALGQTNFHWMTNEYAARTNQWAAVTNSSGSYSNSVFMEGLAQSNSFAGASFGNEGSVGNGTNFATGTPLTSLLDLPIYQDTARTTHIGLHFDQTALWTNLTPWVRLIWLFLISVFCVGYIHTRVQQECILLGLVPTVGFSTGGIVAKATGLIFGATLWGSVPLLIGLGVAVILNKTGGSVMSPLSDAGMATAGTYTSALHLGYKFLTDVFPFEFGMFAMGYLFFFDMTVVASIAMAQKMQKLFS